MHLDSSELIQQMQSGEWYSGSDSVLMERKLQVNQVLADYNRQPSKGHLKSVFSLFSEVGSRSFIEPGFHCDYGWSIDIGSQVYINRGCTFLDSGKISIGDQVLIGPNCQVLAVTHPKDPNERSKGLNKGVPVRIESGAWLGAGVIVLPGVCIGKDAIIGAGAIVTKDVPEGEQVVGTY